MLSRVFPKDKLSIVRGIQAARFTREAIADHYGITVAEIESWERAYKLAQTRGWPHLEGQVINLEPAE